MSTNDDGSGELRRKRKLNLLDFIKNDDYIQPTPSDTSKNFEPMDFQKPKMGLGGPRTQEEDVVEEGENVKDQDMRDINDIYDARPSFGMAMNPMAFLPAQAPTFQRASSPAVTEEKPEESHIDEIRPKLSYSELQALDQKPNSATKNAFKGKKYGIGAALLKKMGYVEGQGLGKHGQGITEPIQQDTRKVGVGLGGGTDKPSKKPKGMMEDLSEDEDSSDEEFYKDVPKKSLYQIITEIESKGVEVPDELKRISDQYAQDSHKPFITLRKEGNTNLEEITNKLDQLNNDLEESITSLKLAEYEESELLRSATENSQRLEACKELQVEIDKLLGISNDTELDVFQKSASLRNEIKFLSNFSPLQIPDLDIQNLIITSIKPTVTTLISQWDPLDFSDDSVLQELIFWKNSMPDTTSELYGELDPFQSLVYSLWYPKIVDALNNWSVHQPNIAITLLLDWNEVLDKSVIDYITRTLVRPKIIDAIEEWDPSKHSENAPTSWIFEYLPYLETSGDEIKQVLVAKFSPVLETWSPSDNIDGLASFREIVGLEAFDNLINKKLLPRLVKVLINSTTSFEMIDHKTLQSLFSWGNFLSIHAFETVLKLGFFNSWKRSLYHSLREKDADFIKISSFFEKWYGYMKPHIEFSAIIQAQIYEALDMINEYVDTGVLISIHKSGLTATQIADMATQRPETIKTVEESVQGIPTHRLQVSFKEVVENYCAKNNLFITPIKNDLSSGHSLFKISNNVNGKNGLVAYIEEDVLWIKNFNGKYEPISLESLQNRF